MVIGEKYVFVHAPKTGGQSVSVALRDNDSTALYQPGHMKFSDLTHHARPGFGFVRNPWDRLVSAYFFLLREWDPGGNEVKGFRDWVLNSEAKPFERFDFALSFIISREATQRIGQRTADIPPIQPCMSYLDGCSMIGKTETLQDDFDTFMRQLGVARGRVPHLNAAPRKPQSWDHFYNTRLDKFVARHYAADIDQGGY